MLSEAQVRQVLEWYRSPRSVPALARAMGVSRGCIQHCIRVCGQYKQAAPEHVAQVRARQTAHRQRLRKRGWL